MSLYSLEEILSDVVSGDAEDDSSFRSVADQLFHESGLDHFRGGYFNQASKGLKTLPQQLQLATQFILAGSYLTDATYSRQALMCLDYILQYHQLDSGFYASTTRISSCRIELASIKANLDQAQFLAFTHAYDIGKDESFDWTGIALCNTAEQLAKHLNMHPKQVPLALDGAQQIIQQLLPEPEAGDDWSLEQNLNMCDVLFLSATYMRRPDHAEAAIALYSLCQKELDKAPEQGLATALRYLSYQWQQDVFDDLKRLISKQSDKAPCDTQHHTIETAGLLIQHIAELDDITEQTTDSFTGFNIHTGPGLVIIIGISYEARQWLQLADHQYQPHWRYIAIPESNTRPTRAILLHASGKKVYFRNLQELLTSRPGKLTSPAGAF